MKYNAIQMKEAIDKLIDRVKSPRFIDDAYYDAINQIQKMILDDRVENIKRQRNYSSQSSTRLRNELYTLVKPTINATITNNLVSFPSDYYYLLLMQNTVNGEKNACLPLTFNEKGLINRNPFKKPSSIQTYYTENNSGWQIELPSGAIFSKCEIDYIKFPNTVSIGKESNKIFTGTPIVIGTEYIVYSECVHNNIRYYEGQKFTAANTTFTEGILIPSNVIVDSDMPETLHDEIIRGAAAIMNGTIEDYQKESNLFTKNEMQ